ncbi:acyl-CoA binding protein, isoform 1, ACBP1, putative [Plasmodium gaboni]|uniref:Acyl-CoA binding protein, isoform 1, ACBP1, putative n=1 Tax=Plasmodium gaboni TaxID=647221 RepID=A0ABY1UGA8_9APIC|nr:acyl-CoA binding protein, isoform 1, ACBP1, putative [Plasmodium gaboni]
MESKKNCNIFSLYSDNKNQKGTLRTKKEKNLKYKKGDVIKTKSNETDIKCNEEVVAENDNSSNNCCANNNAESESNVSICNINYNDMSKNLTEKELYDVLNSLKECPSKEDLRNIWSHTRGVGKEGLDNVYLQLKASIQKYLDDDFLNRTDHSRRERFVYNCRLEGHISRIFEAVGNEEVEYTKDFYTLINGKHTLDDILKFIYSFLEHLKTLKKQLHQKHQKELLADVEQDRYIREQCKFRR